MSRSGSADVGAPGVHGALAATAPATPLTTADRSLPALRLAETAVQLRELAEIAASRGAAHARLQLHPAELGGIEIRLRVTSEGLTASIAAERPEAVQALQQAGAELRRSLEQRGLTVLAVDVALAADGGAISGQGAGAHAHAHADRSQHPGTTRPTGRQEAAADAMEADPTVPTRVPAGALVDVLA